jgi:transcriptional regulator with GAF, ATPase, and Fis domain
VPPPLRLDDGELPDLDDPAFPVRHGGDLLGAITVGMPPQERMTPATERLLVDLSAQAGLVLRNVALVEELQRSRQRLSPRRTRLGGASSATCTTEPSSAS